MTIKREGIKVIPKNEELKKYESLPTRKGMSE